MNLKQTMIKLRPEIDAALAEIAKKHGLTSLVTGKGRFDPEAGHFSFVLEGVAAGGTDKAGAIYDQMREVLELPERGECFVGNGGRTHKIVGMNSTATKVITEGDGGEKYVWKIDAVKRLCKAIPVVSFKQVPTRGSK